MLKNIFLGISHIISILFHPLMMLTYILTILLLANPFLFGIRHISEGAGIYLYLVLYTYLFPAIAVLLMKALGLIQSLQMETKNERIGPFIASGIFYLWFFRNIYSDPNMPVVYISAVLGATMALFGAFFINLFYKISIHAVGVGGLLGLTVITISFFSYGSIPIDRMGTVYIGTYLLLLGVIVICGLVGTARLFLAAHQPKEIYWGYALGMMTQIISIKLLL
jgi:hypothetical protein